jgi:hypothetical protein
VAPRLKTVADGIPRIFRLKAMMVGESVVAPKRLTRSINNVVMIFRVRSGICFEKVEKFNGHSKKTESEVKKSE